MEIYESHGRSCVTLSNL